MKNAFIVILLTLGCATGKEKDASHFVEIDFTYDSGWQVAFSMKVDKGGAAFLGDGRWDKKFYTGTLSPSQLVTLDSLVNQNPLKDYEGCYTSDKEDQSSFQIVLKDSKEAVSVYSYGGAAPSAVEAYCRKLRQLREDITFEPKDTAVDFKSLGCF